MKVEWKKLGDVCKVHTGSQLNRTDMLEVGAYPVVNGGREYSGFTDKHNETANTITISQGGESAGYVNWIDVDFWAGAHCYIIENQDNCDKRFLYHALKDKERELQTSKQGAGIPGLNRATLYKQIIPLPTLAEQARIVGILDTFSASIENLKEQIAQRRKQYEHYRDKLLDLDGKEGVDMKTLLDVLEQPITDGPHETPIFYDEGIPFISADAIVKSKIDFNRKRGYISIEYDNLCRKKYSPQLNDIYLVKSGSTTGKVAIVNTNERFNIWSPLAAIRVNKDNNPYYFYYLLQTKQIQDQVKLKSSQGSQPNLSMRVLEKFIIPLPSLQEQSRIVSILDTFEASIANLEAQLKERQKQYEYYRNKLLTFEE